MFKQDQAKIQAFAMASPENTARVLQWVGTTANQRFYRMRPMWDQIDHFPLEDCKFLTARQRANMRYLWAARDSIYAEIWKDQSALSLMDFLVTLPGLGVVKAGFAAQCLKGIVGCIDTHNQKLYGIDKALLRLSKSPQKRAEQLALYIDVCHTLGTAELWDKWCIHVYNTYAKYGNKALDGKPHPWYFASAEAVSALHVEIICKAVHHG